MDTHHLATHHPVTRRTTVFVALLLLVILSGCRDGSAGHTAPAAAPSTTQTTRAARVPLLDQGQVRVVRPEQRFATGYAQSLEVAFGSVWTVGGDHVQAVSRLDPSTGRVSRVPLPVDATLWSVQRAGRWLWIPTSEGLFRLDPATEALTRLTTRSTGLTMGFGSLWLSTGHRLVRLDPRTGRVVARLVVAGSFDDGGTPPTSVALGSVWWPTLRKSGAGPVVTLLHRVDPRTDEIVATDRIVGDDVVLLAAGGNAWLKTGLDINDAPTPGDVTTLLERFDPEAGQPVPGTKVRLVHRGASAVSASADGPHLWFPISTGEGPDVGRLIELDARTGEVVRSLDLSRGGECGYNVVRKALGSLWTASGICEEVTRWPLPGRS